MSATTSRAIQIIGFESAELEVSQKIKNRGFYLLFGVLNWNFFPNAIADNRFYQPTVLPNHTDNSGFLNTDIPKIISCRYQGH